MKRFFSLFYTDLHWKLISLVLAFIIWFIGSNMYNLHENDSFDFRLRLNNEGILANEGLLLVNPDALAIDVSVGVRATRRYMEVLNEASASQRAEMIIPSIDFRVVNVDDVRNSEGPLTVRMYVSVNLYPGYEHFSINPRFVDVEIEAITRQIFPVTIDVIGEVDSGVELRPISVANNNVAITGSRTNVAQIGEDGVRVQVDIRGVNFDVAFENLPLVVFDHDGNDITNTVHLSVEETTAFVSVWPIQTVEVSVGVTGDIPVGFVLESEEFTVDPGTVEVVGPYSVLQGLEYIPVEIDLSDRIDSFVEYIDITEWLPDGVSLRSGFEPMVAVGIGIEPVERWTFFVPVDDVRTVGISVSYAVVSEIASVRIELFGSRALLSEIDPATDIGLEIDLRNLPIGTHLVPIIVDLPDGIELAQRAPTLRVEINEPAVDEVEEYIPVEETDQVTDYNNGDINDYNTNDNADQDGTEYDYAYNDPVTPDDEETDD
ncbi:MAG: CdaR family protein [Firmicutes bacterium]|nr:CdaR family protein [Bacillota bacterium]